MDVTSERFGTFEGSDVFAHRLENDHGMTVTCIDYGCIITDIVTPDAKGNRESVVLGFDDMDHYVKYSPYFGAFVGRTAGRIKQGRFTLGGNTYQLPQNENANHIHGGPGGFSKIVWHAETFHKDQVVGVVFSYTSPDGEEGYPGTVEMKVTYTLNNKNELNMTYDAVSDAETILNVTNHSYFNLSGNLKRTIVDHRLRINSDRFAELDGESLPTGQLLDVSNTLFDLRQGRKIREGIENPHPQHTIVGDGYDHPFLLSANHDQEILLVDEESGRRLVIETDEPAVVLYTGNKLGSKPFSIRGVPAQKYLGLCLETQKLPDAVHHDHFPSIVLKQGERFRTSTTYTFGNME